MTPAARTGILGGTLDPVHVGHVETALAARRALSLDRVIVMPSGMPPHRQHQPGASRYHRFAMTALAVTGLDGLELSDFEIGRPGPSYTADTLERLHSIGLDASQIFFITGADAFAEIATWSRYPDVLDMAHFAAVSRPGYPANRLLTELPALASRMTTRGTGDAHAASKTLVFLVDAQTPPVSSTDIRRRLASGESIRGLVPAAVETYVHQHGLYASHAQPHPQAADHLHD